MSITLNKKRFNLLNMNTNDRIRKRMEAIGLRQKDLVAKTGASRGTVSLWINGPSEPQGENLLKLARVLSCQPEWILNGTGEPDDMKLDNAEMGPLLQGVVPLINSVQAGAWTTIKEMNIPFEQIEFVRSVSAVSPHAFALRVVGDSMFNPSHSKSLSDGDIVTVDPNVQTINGSIVVALLENEEQATIKMLVIEGTKRFLRPLNPQFPIINIEENTRIIGVAVDKIKSLR